MIQINLDILVYDKLYFILHETCYDNISSTPCLYVFSKPRVGFDSVRTSLYTEQTHLDNLFYDWTYSATKLFTQLLRLDLGNSCALQYDVAVYWLTLLV